jgi:hypothetical protein
MIPIGDRRSDKMDMIAQPPLPSSTLWRDGAVLIVLLLLPSLYLIEGRLGDRSVPLHIAYVMAAVWLWQQPITARFEAAIGERRARWLALLTLLFLIAAFAVVYPLANSGRFGGGNDSDEALNQATRALLHGRYPYLERTYLGNEISPMPGSLLLAVPFVLLGNGVYQSFFWIPAGAYLLWLFWERRTARTLLFVWLVLAACPAILHQLVTGGDYTANALMILVPAILLVREGSPASFGTQLAVAVWLGVALSSRANFAFIVPLVFSRLWQVHGRSRAVALTGATLGAALAVTLPFFLANPGEFSPLHTRTKLGELRSVLPHADLLLPLSAAALALALSRPRWNWTTAAFLRNAALVQAYLILPAAILWAAAGKGAPFFYSIFAQFFLFFGLAAWVTWQRQQQEARNVPAV